MTCHSHQLCCHAWPGVTVPAPLWGEEVWDWCIITGTPVMLHLTRRTTGVVQLCWWRHSVAEMTESETSYKDLTLTLTSAIPVVRIRIQTQNDFPTLPTHCPTDSIIIMSAFLGHTVQETERRKINILINFPCLLFVSLYYFICFDLRNVTALYNLARL